MALIKIELDYPLEDGMSLTFKAPCDCTAITGLKVYYPQITEDEVTNANATFSFKDTHLNVLNSLGNLFMAGATVKVVVDTVNNYAFIQNADTNGYLENKFNSKANSAQTFTVTIPLSGWSASAPYTQEVTVPNMLATYAPIADIELSDNVSTRYKELESWGMVTMITTEAERIVVTCDESVPTCDMTVKLKVVF